MGESLNPSKYQVPNSENTDPDKCTSITPVIPYTHYRLPLASPLSNISTLAILIPPGKSPQNAENGVPKMNFPELPGPRVSVEILQNFPESPGVSRPIPISDFGVPIFSVFRAEW